MAAKRDLPMLPATNLKPQANCIWDGCMQKAVICEEIEPGKGRHNLCEYHWLEAHKAKSKRWCESRGLFTVEQKRDYCMNIIHHTLKPMPMTDRKPGQDDEERAAA